MKSINSVLKTFVLMAAVLSATSCHDLLDEPAENRRFSGEVDYTKTQDMILPVLGAYAYIQNNVSLEEGGSRGWEDFPVISVRGDDVNAGGEGDQQDFEEEDKFNYNKGFWMFNSVWQNLYNGVVMTHTAIESVEKYKEYAANAALADQYIAELKVLQSFLLFQAARVWGDIIIPTSSDMSTFPFLPVTTREEAMQHISDEMETAASLLANLRPNERTDIKGGVTKYTALALKALANLELKNYQGVADATSQIISSNKFSLEADYYNLFKIPGKLNNENLFELQYSDFGQGTGTNRSYNFAFFGPEAWAPVVGDAGAGWGFFEPSLKWIKFMLDREEKLRLQTSVLFTNRGIAEIKKDAKYTTTLPDWITNVTPSGDVISDYPRAMFASGKHYLPSNQLTPGRKDYGTGKNFIVIRYAEILLMHAEALARGASSSAMTVDQAVNAVRTRAQLPALSGVTADQVMDEKFAELAMEWGTRYYDMVRLGRYDELSYEDRVFTEDKIFLPYPQSQVDKLPQLKN